MKLTLKPQPKRFIKAHSGEVSKIVKAYFKVWASKVAGIREVDYKLEAEIRKAAKEFANQKMKPVLARQVDASGTEMSKRIDRARKKCFGWLYRAVVDAHERKDFSPISDLILEYLNNRAIYYEVEFSASMIDTLRNVLAESAEGGWSVAVTERALRGFVGLTSKQSAGLARQVTAYLEAEIEAGATRGAAQLAAEKFAAKRGFHAEMLRREVISTTETARAYGFGQQESVMQAIDAGVISKADKVWRTSGDDRVRDEHAAMEGETVPIDEPFSNGSMYPDDINERCTAEYEVEVV